MGEILRGELTAFHGIDLLRKICNHPDLATSLADAPDYSDPKYVPSKARAAVAVVVGVVSEAFSRTFDLADLLFAWFFLFLVSPRHPLHPPLVPTLHLACVGCYCYTQHHCFSVPLPWQRSGKMIVLRQLLRLWHNKGHR